METLCELASRSGETWKVSPDEPRNSLISASRASIFLLDNKLYAHLQISYKMDAPVFLETMKSTTFLAINTLPAETEAATQISPTSIYHVMNSEGPTDGTRVDFPRREYSELWILSNSDRFLIPWP